jgi:hypothetical protein
MISKGVDYYGYIDDEKTGIDFQFPDDLAKSTQIFTDSSAGEMFHGNCQITEDDIGIFDHYGHYEWTAKGYDVTMTDFANIAPSTGNLQNNGGNVNWLGEMLKTPSYFSAKTAISYGFYDAGPGWGSLTNQDQSYVYITPTYYNWMGGLAKDSTLNFSDSPFAAVALPGVHDAGMFDPTLLISLLKDANFVASIANALGPLVGLPVEMILALSSSALLRLIIDYSFTQKDTIATMLGLGIRYFDFRPGYCLPFYTGGLYHQHKFIPGYPYLNFLEDILTFLCNHPTEIVVVCVNSQGFFNDSMKPTVEVLNQYLTNALTATGMTDLLVCGDKNDLASTYATLISEKKRLIFLNYKTGVSDADKYDSYDGDAYTTTNVENIIGALNGMSSTTQAKHDFTVLQLQGTAEGTGGGIFSGIATMSDASSPILSTKAMFDNQTYPWLRKNVAANFDHNQTIVFLNDFGDNALTSAAIAITKQRLAPKS